jgi:multidrug efflux pump subunit AcrA (membrane-fusion protein)
VGVWQPVEITLDAARARDGQETRPYPGRVVSVAPSAAPPQNATQGFGLGADNPSRIVRFPVKVALLRTDRQLKPGMSVDVDILTASRPGVLLLPLEAVDLGVRPARVRLLRAGQPVTASVQTGLKDETRVEIRSGLREGDRVLPIVDRGIPSRRRDLDPTARTGGGGRAQ